jgi:hypothetical protein
MKEQTYTLERLNSKPEFVEGVYYCTDSYISVKPNFSSDLDQYICGSLLEAARHIEVGSSLTVKLINHTQTETV